MRAESDMGNLKEGASPDLASMVPECVRAVMEQLVAGGFEAYIVGGCVRDAMLGKEPHDWDMTTNATPDQMKHAVSFRSFDSGIKHGTITFVVDHEPIEVTTYRTDGAYSDGRHPDSIEFANRLEDDLSRRDFTVNAMAWSPEAGVVDPYGGVADLRNGMLRCVGDARQRFSEDGLRIMRALRFAAMYGLSVEDSTAKAAREKRSMLDAVSEERISAELIKMMAAEDGVHLGCIVKQFSDVILQILPELKPTYGFDQQNPHHDRDCWIHMVDVMANLGASPSLRLAGLLHDAGKPAVQTVGQDGIAHYRGHAEASEKIAAAALRRLKFPRKMIEEVCFLVRQHDNWPSPTMRSARRFLARCGDEQRAWDLLALMKADRMAHAGASIEEKLADLVAFEPCLREALAEGAAFTLKDLQIGGADLIERGWQPGPALGAELDRLFDLVLSGEVPNERAALLDELQDFESQGITQK